MCPRSAANAALRAGRDLEPLGPGRRADLHRLARADPQRRGPRGGRDHHAARAALRDRARMHRSPGFTACSKSRRPRAWPRSPISTASPRRSRSRSSPPGTRSITRPSTRRRKALAGKRIKSMEILWHEDVHKWHPGQQWIWEPGGFGVFDPGINAFSIATKIFPGRLFVQSAELQVPANAQTPIAADIVFSSPQADGPLNASLDWRRSEGEEWTIAIETTDGDNVRLEDGGATLFVDGADAERRRARRISRHLPQLRRPDRRAAQPRRCRAVPACRRLPARRQRTSVEPVHM